jgi:hypothetical protein
MHTGISVNLGELYKRDPNILWLKKEYNPVLGQSILIRLFLRPEFSCNGLNGLSQVRECPWLVRSLLVC